MTENENTNAQASLSHAKSHELAVAIIKILDAKKAHNIRLLHVESKTIITDYFIICSGTSRTQIKALADEVDAKIEEAGAPALHKEGLNEATWILLDFASVIVHIFNSDTRRFYNLEKLWNDAEEMDISQYITSDSGDKAINTENADADDDDVNDNDTETEFDDDDLFDDDDFDFIGDDDEIEDDETDSSEL